MTVKMMTLDDVLADSKESRYINDGYYALLREDLKEWKARGDALTGVEQARYQSIILHENWLLDQREFEQWYQLFSSQCCYWAPANVDMPDDVTGDPQSQVTIFFDDRRRMGDRIVWLRTGVASSQLPVSRTTHNSSGFVRLPTMRTGEVKVRSSFIMHELRAHHPVQSLTGWMGHVFVEEKGETKIDRKIVCLLDAARGRHNPTFLI